VGPHPEVIHTASAPSEFLIVVAFPIVPFKNVRHVAAPLAAIQSEDAPHESLGIEMSTAFVIPETVCQFNFTAGDSLVLVVMVLWRVGKLGPMQ
jgi:hypothetical protein